ncbi:hypothetical protein EON65_25160 [archaeon]|nr:MAG: hypothetical protein EON65_25160 [archaeon]
MKEEAQSAFDVRGYDHLKYVRQSGYAIDFGNSRVYIICRLNDGFVPKAGDLSSASMDEKTRWASHLCEAVCGLHINNVFHQDISNGPSRYDSNVMIDNHRITLRVIDLGDSVRPSIDAEATIALQNDMQGMCNFLEKFGKDWISTSPVYALLKREIGTITRSPPSKEDRTIQHWCAHTFWVQRYCLHKF